MHKTRIKAVRLMIMMLGVVLLICACTVAEDPTTEQDTVYTVRVVDAAGDPYTFGVIVRIQSNGEQIAVLPIQKNGTVQKQLPGADYTVELVFTASDEIYYYDQTDLTLSADKTELEIVVARGLMQEPQTIMIEDEEVPAYPIAVGSSYLELTDGRSYYLFAPEQSGHYRFAVTGGDATVGYYGTPHFVRSENIAEEIVGNGFGISINESMITTEKMSGTVLVLGVEASGDTACILHVERIGDPIRTIEDEPWTVYAPTAVLHDYIQPYGSHIADFDITASSDAYRLVYNENEGYYHLNDIDGPLVLVRLGKNAPQQYFASFQGILGRTGLCKYFYDDAGKLIKKESYDACLLEYFAYMNEDSGLYPLTKDLQYIIQQCGDFYDWFDPQSEVYIFKNEDGTPVLGVNRDISWLYACCYLENE